MQTATEPFAFQTVKKPLWVVRRTAVLQMQSEPSDMCGGFGNLAVQGFFALFPAWETHKGESETTLKVEKGRRRRTFSTH